MTSPTTVGVANTQPPVLYSHRTFAGAIKRTARKNAIIESPQLRRKRFRVHVWPQRKTSVGKMKVATLPPERQQKNFPDRHLGRILVRRYPDRDLGLRNVENHRAMDMVPDREQA